MQYRLRSVSSVEECRELWRQAIPADSITDLWEVRYCFHRHFQRPLRFIAAEDHDGICGFLPLSWIKERSCYGYFPGEVWDGKTWLEQNRLIARNGEILRALLAKSPSAYHLRYLLPPAWEAVGAAPVVDEIGYLFNPPEYAYDIEKYFEQFSHKSAKRIKREIAEIEERGVEYRYDERADFDLMVGFNLGRFGSRSYFSDPRFTDGFRTLMEFLQEHGWLRLTTVLIEGVPAAVDMGCLYQGTYTLLAGGTHEAYPGVAKLINLHHMQRGCRERFERVDFLCGDFSWKKIFHLTPRPLYLMSSLPVEAALHDHVAHQPAIVRPDGLAVRNTMHAS
jgi:hypothetical protein